MNRSLGISQMDAEESAHAESRNNTLENVSETGRLAEITSMLLNKRNKRARSEQELYSCKLCGEPLFSIIEAFGHLESEHGKDLEENPDAYLAPKAPRRPEGISQPQAQALAPQQSMFHSPATNPHAHQQHQVLHQVQPHAETPSPSEHGSVKRAVRRRYSCSVCPSTNNNYKHMINHVNNKHKPAEGAKLIVNNVFSHDDKKHRENVTNLINEKLGLEHQMTRTAVSVENNSAVKTPEDSDDNESSEVTEMSMSSSRFDCSVLKNIPQPKVQQQQQQQPAVQQQQQQPAVTQQYQHHDDSSTDSHASVISVASSAAAPVATREVRQPLTSDIGNKLARLIEKQTVYIDESVQQTNDKGSALDKKMTTMTSHVTNMNTRLDYMDNRLMGIEQKLAKLMRLIGSQ